MNRPSSVGKFFVLRAVRIPAIILSYTLNAGRIALDVNNAPRPLDIRCESGKTG